MHNLAPIDEDSDVPTRKYVTDAIAAIPKTETALWDYDTVTTMADPGSGRLRTDSGGAGSTQMAINVTTNQGTDRTDLLTSLRADDLINIQQQANVNNWARYRVTATPTNNTTWFSVPVTLISSGGVAPPKNSPLVVRFTFGAGGGAGAGGGGGMDEATADARYVNVDGDTMTDSLTVNGTVSATQVYASGDVSTDNVVIGSGITVGGGIFISESATGVEFNGVDHFAVDATDYLGMWSPTISLNADSVTVVSTAFTVDSAGTATVVVDKGSAENYGQFEFRTAGAQKYAVGTNPAGELVIYNATADNVAFRINETTALITVAADPTAPLGIATKQYVDSKGGGGGGGMDEATADARYVNVTGDYMTGDLYIVSPNGQDAIIGFFTAGTPNSLRWSMGKTPVTEGAGNTGSDYSIARYDNNGNWINNPLSISRDTGAVNVENDFNVGDVANVGWLTARTGGWFGGDLTTSGAVKASNLRVGQSLAYGADYQSIETSGAATGGGHFLFGVAAGDKTAYLQSHEGSVVLRPNNNTAAQFEVQNALTVANTPIQLNAAVTQSNHAVPRSYVDSRTPKITSSTTAPSSPAVGDVWIDMN